MEDPLIHSERLQRLRKLGEQVRQVAISRQGDVEGWRIARLMRDANTVLEADKAERQFEGWSIGPSGNIKMHTSTFVARRTSAGWVIDATTDNGRAEQLLGLFISQEAATRWITEHPADWWKLRTALADAIPGG